MQLYDTHILWMPWVEFALLIMLFVIHAMQPQAIANGVAEIGNPNQRRYVAGGERPMIYWMQSIYQLGVLALTALVTVRALWGISSAITIGQFGLVAALCLVVGLVKIGTDYMIQGIFQFPIHMPTYIGHRSKMGHIVGIVLLIYLLLEPLWSGIACWLVPVCILAFYWGIIVWELATLFRISIEHLAMITIYVLHNEILPFVIIGIGTIEIMTV